MTEWLNEYEGSPNDRGDIILGNSISQLLFDHIEVVHIGLVVLAVVDLHYLRRDHLHIRIIKNVDVEVPKESTTTLAEYLQDIQGNWPKSTTRSE